MGDFVEHFTQRAQRSKERNRKFVAGTAPLYMPREIILCEYRHFTYNVGKFVLENVSCIFPIAFDLRL